MTVVAINSALITNLNTGLPTAANEPVTQFSGKKRVQFETIETTNPNSTGSTYRMARVPSSAKITSIRLFCDAITSGAVDIGLYRTAADGGAVVDVDAYASAQSIATASVVGIECAFEARDIASCRNYVWQDAGLTADPRVFYDIVLTTTANTTAVGTVSLQVEYVVD